MDWKQKTLIRATWWKLSQRGKPEIVPVEVIKETAQQVVVREEDDWWGGTRERRCNKAGEFFATFADAKGYAIQQATRQLQNADDERSRRIEELKQCQQLTEPSLSSEEEDSIVALLSGTEGGKDD